VSVSLGGARSLEVFEEVKKALGHTPSGADIVEFARTHPGTLAHHVFFVEFTDGQFSNAGRLQLARQIVTISVSIKRVEVNLIPSGLSKHVLTAAHPDIRGRRVTIGEEEAIAVRFGISARDVQYILEYIQRLRQNATAHGLSSLIEERAQVMIHECQFLRAELEKAKRDATPPKTA
jgi:hypothetical protein